MPKSAIAELKELLRDIELKTRELRAMSYRIDSIQNERSKPASINMIAIRVALAQVDNAAWAFCSTELGDKGVIHATQHSRMGFKKARRRS